MRMCCSRFLSLVLVALLLQSVEDFKIRWALQQGISPRSSPCGDGCRKGSLFRLAMSVEERDDCRLGRSVGVPRAVPESPDEQLRERSSRKTRRSLRERRHAAKSKVARSIKKLSSIFKQKKARRTSMVAGQVLQPSLPEPDPEVQSNWGIEHRPVTMHQEIPLFPNQEGGAVEEEEVGEESRGLREACRGQDSEDSLQGKVVERLASQHHVADVGPQAWVVNERGLGVVHHDSRVRRDRGQELLRAAARAWNKHFPPPPPQEDLGDFQPGKVPPEVTQSQKHKAPGAVEALGMTTKKPPRPHFQSALQGSGEGAQIINEREADLGQMPGRGGRQEHSLQRGEGMPGRPGVYDGEEISAEMWAKVDELRVRAALEPNTAAAADRSGKEDLRAWLSDDGAGGGCRGGLTDVDLLRFIAYRHGDVGAALEQPCVCMVVCVLSPSLLCSHQLEHAAKWRKEQRVDDVLSEDRWSSFDPGKAEVFWLGRDKTGRPTLVLRSIAHHPGAIPLADFQRYLIYTMEEGRRRYGVGASTQMNLLVDRVGAGLANQDPQLLSVVLPVFRDVYADIIYRCYVAPTSWIFRLVWVIAAPLVDSRQRKRVKLLSGRWKETLLNLFDPETLPAHLGGTREEYPPT
ncbi:unnamed protein product [Discosporangium mesarthrocarpum]